MQKSNSVKAAASVAFGILGAMISRWHGGGFISGSPKAIKNLAWALPFAAAAAWAWHDNQAIIVKLMWIWHKAFNGSDYTAFPLWMWWAVPLTVFLVVLALCVAGKATGHGGGMDLATNPKEPGAGRDPEILEYLILWIRPLFHVKHSAWYDALLLAIVGLAAVAGGALAVGMVDPVSGWIIALGGLLKPFAYWVGHNVVPSGRVELPADLDEATEIGEALTGFFAYATLAIALWIIT